MIEISTKQNVFSCKRSFPEPIDQFKKSFSAVKLFQKRVIILTKFSVETILFLTIFAIDFTVV